MSTEIIEGNKLIAEFMGIDVYETYERVQLVPIGKLNRYFLSGQGKYHSSWDWLMPVVEKIKNYSPDHEIEITMGKTFCRVYARDLDAGRYLYGVGSTEGKPIDAVYKAVIQFIKWYQNQILNNTINHGKV